MTLTISSPWPVHQHYGVYHGVPIARHYINRYLAALGPRLGGRVLEFGAPTYAAGLGCEYEIMDVDETNPQATIRADICGDRVGQDLAERFDVILCTAVLQLVDDPRRAVDNMHRMLKPGGILVLAEKAVSKVDSWFGPADRWRFTHHGLATLLAGFSRVHLSHFGNVYVTCAYLLGLPVSAIDQSLLDVHDPEHPLVGIAHAEK